MTRARRSGLVLVAAGLLCLGAAAVPALAATATADDEAGSGLGSYSLSANAPILQVREDYAAQQCSAAPAGTGGCEGVIGESVSSLTNGPVGHALASVAWPGTLVGNLGTLLITVGGGQVPPDATRLNSPVRAESHIGGKNPVITDYPPAPAPPALHMQADAGPTKVTAEAAIGGAQSLPVGSIGTGSSSTRTELTGVDSAVADAHSEVHDITIAGVVHLSGLVSDAVATTTNGVVKATGKTTVTGASVLGFPVTIDENGITVVSAKVPLPAQATDAVNAALKNAGISVSLSAPHGTPQGGNVVFDAGSLVLVWEQQPGATLSAVVGGAQVAIQSAAGFGCLFNCVPGGVTGPTPGGLTPGTPPLPGTPSGPLTGVAQPPSVTGGPAPQVVVPQATGYGGRLPKGLSPWLGALALAGSFLTMAGLRRLPDRVLVAPSSTCPNGEQA
ncbi:MAG TPA: hypothetical protein VMZ11_04595 [Mycobacteriales bacterium]|nr:hypothetical protein [Mycobacteriales bacterium]